MSARYTAPTQAYAPDADRAGPDASAPPPEWLVYLLARLWLLVLRLRGNNHRSFSPSWIHDRPDLPPGSAQQLAASIRGSFGTAIAWMCLRRGIGPGHKDWPELSRAIVRFGGSLARFRPGLPACGLQWWENPNIVPGMRGEAAPTPAADALALLLSHQAGADAPPPARCLMPAGPAPAAAAPAAAPVLRRPVLAYATAGPPTGPPTGPPRARLDNRLTLNARGRSTAGPAVLIRAAAMPYRYARAA